MNDAKARARPRPRATRVEAVGDQIRSQLVVLLGPNVGKAIDLFPRAPREGEPPEAARQYLVGSAAGANLHIPQAEVAPRHALFLDDCGAVRLQDLGSRLCTQVNDEPVTDRPLTRGDEIRIGRNLFRFLVGPELRPLVDAELARLQTHDTLTGLLNRRYFEQTLEREFRRCERYGRELVVMLVALDDWPRFQEVLGGLGSDLVARQLGRLVSRACSRDDSAGRLAPDAFAVLLPETSLEAARRQAEALREQVTRAQPSLRGAGDGRGLPRLTASIGLAHLDDDAEGPMDLVREAQSNALAASQDGGNQVLG